MTKVDNNDLIRDFMKPFAKERKAKATYTCVYKKEDPYFWRIVTIPYIQGQYTVFVDIKLWQYDEFLTSITHPHSPPRFTDKLRHEGFFAMRPYSICRRDIGVPIDSVTNIANTELLQEWCKDVFQDAIKRIDGFVQMVESEYAGLNDFIIKNADNDLILAAFACIYDGNYADAEVFLKKAKEKEIVFNRSFGSATRDLRDVLMDYCEVKRLGIEWTRDMVLSGL